MTPDQTLDYVTDTIVSLYEDYHQNDGWDRDAAAIQVRRLLRDNCAELWEESAAEVEASRLQKRVAELEAEAQRLAVAHTCEVAARRGREKRVAELEAIVRRVAVGLKAHHDPLSSEGRRIDHYDLSNAIANAVFDAAFDPSEYEKERAAAAKGGA